MRIPEEAVESRLLGSREDSLPVTLEKSESVSFRAPNSLLGPGPGSQWLKPQKPRHQRDVCSGTYRLSFTSPVSRLEGQGKDSVKGGRGHLRG